MSLNIEIGIGTMDVAAPVLGSWAALVHVMQLDLLRVVPSYPAWNKTHVAFLELSNEKATHPALASHAS